MFALCQMACSRPFFPPLMIYVSFFRVHAMDFGHNSLLASNAARISIQKNSFKDKKILICCNLSFKKVSQHSQLCGNSMAAVISLYRHKGTNCIPVARLENLEKKPNSEKKGLMRFWHIIHLMAGKKIKWKNKVGLFIVSLNSSLLFKFFCVFNLFFYVICLGLLYAVEYYIQYLV